LLDADKELWSLGLAQFVGSFFSIFPPSGSFTRSAVNFDAGGKSPLAGLVQAAIVLIVVLLLTPTLFHLPYCILAAIVFVRSLHFVFNKISRADRSDCCVMDQLVRLHQLI
jgi:MFS superfamily sulfate permease-like transporter